MHTHNEIRVRAPAETCLEAAADVERWPEILPHYRTVRFHRKDGFGAGRVEMAATRRFGPLPYPVWWVSEMHTDPEEAVIRYRHVDGITEGMDVAWRIEPVPGATRIEIVHDWEGPGWPLIGGFAARRVIGPHFIHVVAGRTLEGIRRFAESGSSRPSDSGEGAEADGPRGNGTREMEPGGEESASGPAADGTAGLDADRARHV